MRTAGNREEAVPAGSGLMARIRKDSPSRASEWRNALVKALRTNVVEIRRPRNVWAGIARNRAQVGVDRQQIALGHVSKRGPRHHLEKISVERKCQAVGRAARESTARMNV